MQKQTSASTFHCVYFGLGKFAETNCFVFQFEKPAEAGSGADLGTAFEKYNDYLEKNPSDRQDYKKLKKLLEPFVKANPEQLVLFIKLVERYFEEKNAERKTTNDTTKYGLDIKKLDELASASPNRKAAAFLEVFGGLMDRYMEEAARKAGDKDKAKYISLLPEAYKDFLTFVDRVSPEYKDGELTFLTTFLGKFTGEFGEKFAKNLRVANDKRRESKNAEILEGNQRVDTAARGLDKLRQAEMLRPKVEKMLGVLTDRYGKFKENAAANNAGQPINIGKVDHAFMVAEAYDIMEEELTSEEINQLFAVDEGTFGSPNGFHLQCVKGERLIWSFPGNSMIKTELELVTNTEERNDMPLQDRVRALTNNLEWSDPERARDLKTIMAKYIQSHGGKNNDPAATTIDDLLQQTAEIYLEKNPDVKWKVQGAENKKALVKLCMFSEIFNWELDQEKGNEEEQMNNELLADYMLPRLRPLMDEAKRTLK